MRDEDELAWARYEKNLRSRGLTDETISGKYRAMESLAATLPRGTSLFTAAPEDVETWLAGIRDDPRYAASTHATYYRRAHAFYAWAHKREYVDRSPMAVLDPVREEARLIPLPDPAAMAAVLAACRPRRPGWRDRRDYAMLRLLLEAGTPRASELGGLTLERLDMRRDLITIPGKGGLERMIPFGEKAGDALTLWLRARGAHKLSGDPRTQHLVFFTPYGRMTRHGVLKIVKARCALAGVEGIPPHHWRHYSAHEWMAAGGSEGDAMQLFGWRDPSMARRYAAAAAGTRAVAHAAAAAQGDRL